MLNKIKDYLDSSFYEINEKNLRELKLVYSKIYNSNDSDKNSDELNVELNDLKEKNCNEKSEYSNSNFELMNGKPSITSLNEVNSNSFSYEENQVNTKVNTKSKSSMLEFIAYFLLLVYILMISIMVI